MGRFKIHEFCNGCVYVTVSADTTYRAETRVKVVVGEFGKGQVKTDLTAGFRRIGRDLERSSNGFQQRRN